MVAIECAIFATRPEGEAVIVHQAGMHHVRELSRRGRFVRSLCTF